MSKLAGRLGLALGALAFLSPAAFAATDADLARIEQQIQSLKTDYERRIRDLEHRLERAESDARSAKDEAVQASASAESANQQATAPARATPAAAPPANAFNPSISAVLNGQFGAFSRDPDQRRVPGFQTGPEARQGPRGFAIGESELNFNASIDPYLFGNLTLSLSRDNEVEVEEGYIQSTSLPWGFTARAGRFFSGIGYLNEKHAHDWDFIDAPLPYRVLLNNQYRDDGVQIRWLAPTSTFLEFGVEGFRGDGWPAAGAVHAGGGAGSAFMRIGGDIGASSSWLAGLSFLHTGARDRLSEEGDRFTGSDNIGIASAVYKWAPDGNPTQRNLVVAGEYFRGQEQGLFNDASFRQTRSGWYLQAVYQFMPQWRFGLRYDEVSPGRVPEGLFASALDASGHTPRNASALLEYDSSEFGRFRLQYNNDRADRRTSHQLILGYTIIFGPHGAHRF